MEIQEMLYKEIIELRKEVNSLRKDLSSLRLKVTIVAMVLGTAGGAASSMLPFLR